MRNDKRQYAVEQRCSRIVRQFVADGYDFIGSVACAQSRQRAAAAASDVETK
jgi:hypothetical protein